MHTSFTYIIHVFFMYIVCFASDIVNSSIGPLAHSHLHRFVDPIDYAAQIQTQAAAVQRMDRKASHMARNDPRAADPTRSRPRQRPANRGRGSANDLAGEGVCSCISPVLFETRFVSTYARGCL